MFSSRLAEKSISVGSERVELSLPVYKTGVLTVERRALEAILYQNGEINGIFSWIFYLLLLIFLPSPLSF